MHRLIAHIKELRSRYLPLQSYITGSGTVIKTLSKGDEVCFTIDDGYAGATRPYLISICGYTVFTNNLGYYTAATSTTFVDLNFDCGYTGGYRVVTEIDWS